jgi:hypothetical protein
MFFVLDGYRILKQYDIHELHKDTLEVLSAYIYTDHSSICAHKTTTVQLSFNIHVKKLIHVKPSDMVRKKKWSTFSRLFNLSIY